MSIKSMQILTKQILFGSTEYESTLALRYKILREPLGLQFSTEDLAADALDIHIGAFNENLLCGCLILHPIQSDILKMRQVAVDKNIQGLGVGKKLVQFSEDYARLHGFKEIQLNSRETAVPFYLSLGYETLGEPFTEVGMPHLKMFKRLV